MWSSWSRYRLLALDLLKCLLKNDDMANIRLVQRNLYFHPLSKMCLLLMYSHNKCIYSNPWVFCGHWKQHLKYSSNKKTYSFYSKKHAKWRIHSYSWCTLLSCSKCSHAVFLQCGPELEDVKWAFWCLRSHTELWMCFWYISQFTDPSIEVYAQYP